MTSLRQSKRADESSGYSLTQIIGFILAVAIVLGVILPLIARLGNLFYNNPDQGTKVAFKHLADAIEHAEDGEMPIAVTYYIANGFKVVGFDKGIRNINRVCNLISTSSEIEERPKECPIDKSCLALCDENDNTCRTSLKDFRTFDNIEHIYAENDLKLNRGSIYPNGKKSFVLYGMCLSITNPSMSYGTKTVYVTRDGKDVFIGSSKFSSLQQKKIKTSISNLIQELFKTDVDLNLGLSKLCDTNNGFLKQFSSPIGGFYYEPKQLSPSATTDCISGYDFAKTFDKSVELNLNENKNIGLSIFKNGEMILDYTEPDVSLPYPGEYQVNTAIKVQLSYSPFEENNGGNTVPSSKGINNLPNEAPILT